MNYPRILAIMLFWGLSTAGCTTPPVPKQEKSLITASDRLSHVLYSLDSAVADVESFDSLNIINRDDSIQAKSFTIRAEDLLGAMGMPATLADSKICVYKHIRVYLAYRETVGFKLFLVPVNGADLNKDVPGKDILLDSTGAPIVDPAKHLLEKQYVLDLNAPCPKTCADGSPLSSESKP